MTIIHGLLLSLLVVGGMMLAEQRGRQSVPRCDPLIGVVSQADHADLQQLYDLRKQVNASQERTIIAYEKSIALYKAELYGD